MGLDVKYPLLFLLLIPVAITLYVFYRNVKFASNVEKNILVSIRALVYLLLILALTVPHILLPIKGENVIFLVDRSASMKGSEDQILTWIQKSWETKKKDDSFAIISTGKSAAFEQSLTKDEEPIQEFSTEVGEEDTNIKQGIDLATSLIPSNQTGRIVLLSDGNETAGDATEAAKQLKQQNIILDYVPITGQTGSDVAMTDFNVSPTLFKGEKAQIKVKIRSNERKTAVVRISVNNREILKKAVELKEGENQFSFSHMVNDTGMFVYKAEVIADHETFLENNELYGVSNVTGTPKVLLVHGKDDPALSSLLQSAKLTVDSISPKQLPTTLSNYLQYQSIIFNNVAATDIGEKKMKLIEKAVKDFGTGFIMTGGENSFGLGGYFKTTIEKILPVNMDIKGKKKMPSLGLVIVMDRSGSMSGQKLTLAKEAAARSVELLRKEDTLGFIAFDDRPWEIVETAPIKDKKAVMKKIRSVTEGGGTNIFPSLQMAYEKLQPLKLQRKHIILLTDGQSATNANYQSLIEEGKEDNITISTVALGQDADIGLLESLAEYGSGRFYNVTDSTVIPSILSRETVMATRTYIEDHPFYPQIQPYPEWNRFFADGVPQMNAYIAVTPKQTAQVSIVSEKEDPILAEWQYGLGRTVAFTSDTSGKWAGDWARWNEWPNFWAKLVTSTFPSFENLPYDLDVKKENGETTITLHSDEAELLPINPKIISQQGQEMNVTTKMVAPGTYELKMEDRSGMYFLNVGQKTEDGSDKFFQTGFTIPYSEEYLLKGLDDSFLKELISFSGGKKLKKAGDAFSPLLNRSYEKQAISQWLLLVAFLLFFMEIAIRRFGLQSLIRIGGRVTKQPVIKQKQTEPIQQLVKKKVEKDKSKMANKKTTAENIDKGPSHHKKEKQNVTGSDMPTSGQDRMQRLLEAKKRKK